jgi:hypothetical protein
LKRRRHDFDGTGPLQVEFDYQAMLAKPPIGDMKAGNQSSPHAAAQAFTVKDRPDTTKQRFIVFGQFQCIHPDGQLDDGVVDGFGTAADVQQFGMCFKLFDDGMVDQGTPASFLGRMMGIILASYGKL